MALKKPEAQALLGNQRSDIRELLMRESGASTGTDQDRVQAKQDEWIGECAVIAASVLTAMVDTKKRGDLRTIVAKKKVRDIFDNGLKRIEKDAFGQKGKGLDEYLRGVEADFGFEAIDGKGTLSRILDFADADAFYGLLEKKRHFKDIGAGKDHGEYTHRIQWAILALGGAFDDFSSKTIVSDFFAALSLPRFRASPKKINGLWDAVVDRVEVQRADGFLSIAHPFDFRSPERFNTWLREDDNLAPELGKYLRRRYLKRSNGAYLDHKKRNAKDRTVRQVLTADGRKREVIYDEETWNARFPPVPKDQPSEKKS